MKYFQYGEKEINYLKSRDKKMAELIDRVGHIDREVIDDLFTCIIFNITGQQISTKALTSVWGRICEKLGEITPKSVLECGREQLKQCGISYRKADYIIDFAEKVNSGEFDIDAVSRMPDSEAVEYLCTLKGVGKWTGEMILIFCLQRPDVFSYGDLAILRGLCTVYHHRKITPQLFEKYRKRFSPYCTVASLYLWEASGQIK